MPTTLAGVIAATLLMTAISVAQAAGMPDIGSKNFVPGADAPAYLTNENLAVAPGSPGQSPLGTAYNEPASPPPSAAARPEMRSPAAIGPPPEHARLARPQMRKRLAPRTTASRHHRPFHAARNRNTARNERMHRRALPTARGGRTTTAAARSVAGRHSGTNPRHAAARSTSRRG